MKRIRAWGWVFVALVATIGAGGWLLVADLLWTVPMPWLVLTGILALTAAPGLVPALRRRGARWAPVVTFLVACLVGIGVAAGIEPSSRVLVGVLADVPVPAGADPIHQDGCRRCFGWVAPPPQPRAHREIATEDSDTVCREVIAQAQRAGWTLHKEHDDRCGAYLTRPAPFGRYGLTILARGPEAQNTARMTLDGEVRTGPHVWLLVTTDSSS
jgi:hypothetical protein